MPPRSIVVTEAPWVPSTLNVRRPRRGQTSDRRTGVHRPYWELRWFVDGTELRRRFDRAGDATAFALQLQDGFRAGWAYDGAARRFVDPSTSMSDAHRARPVSPQPAPARVPTVLEWTETYWQEKWSSLEPSSRSETARYLNRTRQHFVDVVPTDEEAAAVHAYLRTASFSVRARR